MAIRWRLGIPAAAFICAALLTIPYLIAPAQAQSPEVCEKKCAAEWKALDEKRHELAQREFELKLIDARATKIVMESKGQQSRDELREIAEQRKNKESGIDAARAEVAKLQGELDACLKKCGRVAGTSAPPVDATLRHPFPVSACWQCDGIAKNAKMALATLIDKEAAVATTRVRIFELKAWLSAHASDKSTDAYKDAAKDLGGSESDLKAREAERVEAQRDFDARMADLAKCNAGPDCKPGATTPLDRPPFYPLPEVKAKCADCDGHALELEADIARLRRAELRLALDEDRLSELIKSARRPIEREGIEKAKKDLENVLQEDKNAIVDIAKVIDSDVKALDDCNAKCEKTTTGQNALQGSATGQQKAGDGPKPPVNQLDTPPPPPMIPGGHPAGPPDTSGPPKAPTPPQPPLRPRPPISGIPEPSLPGPGADVRESFKTTITSPYVEDDDDEDTEDEYFTFDVPGDTGLFTLLAAPFFKDKEPWFVFSLERGGYSVTIWGGETPVLTSLFLSELQKRGVINSLDSYTDVCWHFRQAPDPEAAGGSFVPPPRARVLYTLPSPTPFSNPGDRPGDDRTPAVARVDRDGKYNAPLGRPNGSVEVRVAKGCSEHTTVETTVPAGELKRP